MPDITPPDDTALGTQSAALEVGLRVFRQYVLKRFLSRGPLGSAWLVVHEGIGRELSMRFLPEAWLLDERVIERLREGVVKLLEITHPGIVGILDFVRDGQTAAIVSRYVEAESAIDAKAQQPQRCFEVDRLRPWLGQLCEALDFAWRRHQAIHGDLCTANLLITPLGDVKVADFGLARTLYDMIGPTGDPLLAMPPAFCSPERLRGEPVTVADDVHNFGAIVFDLLTSKAPFPQGRTAGDMPPGMAQRRTELGIGGDLIPPEWEEVIAACLAEQPGDRPRSLREAGERLGVVAPLPAEDRSTQPTVLPRPHETVIESRPPSTRPAAPAPIFPTSEMTAAMEPPTMSGSPPPAEVEQEPVPATVDENLGYEETITGIALPPAQATAAGDDASATIAADPAPTPFVPPPPSQPQPTGDDASATVAAEQPKTEEPIAMEDLERTVAQPPVAPPIPAPKPEVPRNLEESVTMPSSARRSAPATQPLREMPVQAPAKPAARFPMWIIPAAIVVAAAVVAPLTLRKEKPAGQSTPDPVPATPAATPEPTPAPTPMPTPTPVPATPQPTPSVRTVAANDLAALAGTGRLAEPLLLTGAFRISAANPPRPGLAGSVIMRPVEPALSAQMRVNVTLAPATTVPAEGSQITLAVSGKYFVREVRRGEDGQLNVTVQQAP